MLRNLLDLVVWWLVIGAAMLAYWLAMQLLRWFDS